MQHFAHEEGRVRTNNAGNLVFDYFIKDHLGNTRMTLTEEQSSTIYLATMESEYSAFEESLFLNLAATRDSTVTAANYTQDISTQQDKTARLNGNIPSRRVGPAKLIAVSPGDSIDMEVFAYFQNGYTNSGNVGQSNVVSAVAAAFGGSASAALGSEARSVYELFNTNAALTFVGSSGNSALPKAYLNYILFDQDFNDIAHDYIQVGSATNTHQQLNLSQSINQGGYIYVWLSNESQTDFNVYFDDLRVTHTKGAILQEDHYYPFGLSINALSSSAPLSKPNNFKYNGKEEQTEFDLNWYDYGARNYDAQLGRWGVIDPLAGEYLSLSPYSFVNNDPIINREIDGRYWVGKDGKSAVEVTVDDSGIIKLGENASDELKKYAEYVSKSGSQTAIEAFQNIAKNQTKVHFKVSKEKIKNNKLGYHQAHDKDGKALEWDDANRDETKGKFKGEAAFITDSEGNLAYKEATITMFEGNLDTMQEFTHKLNYGGGQLANSWTREDVLVSIFSHEIFHDTDTKSVEAIKARMAGGTDKYKVETNAYEVNKKVLTEIFKKKQGDK